MPIIQPSGFQLFKSENLKNNYWILIFAVYLILLSVAVSNHEPWLDEAQPWLLTQDLSLTELLVKYLRYEGHPPLWYLIVMIPAKLGLPYFTINVLSAAISAFGVWLFLRYAPFPAFVKILFPFSYFVFFQYGVVARSYCLIPPLLFLIAIYYEKKMERPVLYSLLLSLLASVSAYTFLMSGAFLFVHLLDVLEERKRLNKDQVISQLIAVIMLGLTALVIFLILKPPPDQSFAQGTNWSLINFFAVCKQRIGGALLADELSAFAGLQTNLSLAVFVITVIWLYFKKISLLLVLPAILILGLFAVKYSNLWHGGIVFLLWIFVLWISFEKNRENQISYLSKLMLTLITTVLAVQVYWAFYAVRYDFSRNYSGSYDAAQYIKSNQLENKKIFVSGWKTTAIAPYFDRNIFYNHSNESPSHRFWFWSTNNQTVVGAGEYVINKISIEQPDVVIFGSDNLDPNANLQIEGYHLAEVFEGNLCWKTGLYEPDSFRIYRRLE